MHLEYECWHCDGSGYVQTIGHFEPEECGHCVQGYVPTAEGMALLAFLKRHGAMFSDQLSGDDLEAHINSHYST